MVSNGAILNGKPATNGHGPLTRPPAPAEALDRAPSADRQQTGSNGADGNGRDKGGRFAKGNRAGRGNPFSRQIAMLRCELVNAVTRKDIRRLARSLLKKAKAGNIAAAKLLLSYCVGQPVQLCVTADGLEGGEGLPGEAVGLPSASVAEFLGKVEAAFFSGGHPVNADHAIEERFGPAWADVDRQINEWQEKDRQRKAARAAKRK